MSLIKPFNEIRPTVGLGVALRSKISVIPRRINDESVEAEAYEYPRFGETKQQCNICLFHISRQKSKEKERPLEKVEI